MTTASFYLRISLDKTGQEAGVERQESECRALAALHGWTIGEIFKDNSVSAVKRKRRPAFEELLASKPELIVMWSVDRLVRKGADLERLIELNVPVHSVQAGPMDLATASGRLNARLLTSVATFEGEIKAERQKSMHAQRVREGRAWWSVRPFGYNQDGTLRQRESARVRRLYQELLAGRSLNGLVRELTEDGFTTTRGKPWSTTSLRVLLLAPRNIGVMVYQGEEVGKGEWPAIVPEETFRAAQRLLGDESRNQAATHGGQRRHLLSGVAKCGVCYGSMVVNNPKRSGGRRRFYICRDKRCVTVPADPIDGHAAGSTLRLLSTPEGRRIWAGRVTEVDVEGLRAEKLRLETELDEAMEDRASGALTRAEHLALVGKVRVKVEEIDAQLAESGMAQAVGENKMTADEIVGKWEDGELSTEEKRIIIDRMLGPVMLNPPGRGARSFKPEKVIEYARGRKPAALTLVPEAQAG